MSAPISPTTSTTGTNATTGATNSSTSNSTPISGANESTFLQLLVAELQNQDPSNPTDGTQFVTQLAEFQQLTTTMNMATDVTGIRGDTDKLLAATAAASAGTISSTQS